MRRAMRARECCRSTSTLPNVSAILSGVIAVSRPWKRQNKSSRLDVLVEPKQICWVVGIF